MTIETLGLMDLGKDGVRNHRKVIKKSKCNNKVRAHRRVAPSALQKLFMMCRDVFRGPGIVPPPKNVHDMSRILDNMNLEDFWLTRDLPFFDPNGAVNGVPRVTTTTIYSCDNFSMALFFLPASSVIPLHNHPGMTVFSKLLLGSMHIKAYDWVDSDNPRTAFPPTPQSKLARLKADKVFTATCNTSVLYPTTGGNIHAFTALTPCILIDVLGPPYSKNDHRDCTYYKDTLFANHHLKKDCESPGEENLVYAWLEEIEMPENTEMDYVQYLGPQIIDSKPQSVRRR